MLLIVTPVVTICLRADNIESIAVADSKRAESLLADAESVVVCGIAGDYCVLETLKNIVGTIGADRVRVYLDGTASIDTGTALNNYMKENNILATSNVI